MLCLYKYPGWSNNIGFPSQQIYHNISSIVNHICFVWTNFTLIGLSMTNPFSTFAMKCLLAYNKRKHEIQVIFWKKNMHTCSNSVWNISIFGYVSHIITVGLFMKKFLGNWLSTFSNLQVKNWQESYLWSVMLFKTTTILDKKLLDWVRLGPLSYFLQQLVASLASLDVLFTIFRNWLQKTETDKHTTVYIELLPQLKICLEPFIIKLHNSETPNVLLDRVKSKGDQKLILLFSDPALLVS